MSTRLAIFDCDGTLSDGQAAVCEAMEHAFALTGFPLPDRHEVRRIVGLSLPQAMARLLPDAGAQAQFDTVEAYKQCFRQARQDGTLHEPLFDGIADLLARLHGQGWMLGVATGKSDRGLTSTLATHGLAHLFSTLQTADRHPSKPHPSMALQAMADCFAEPEASVVIGDTVFDMEMASAAGCRAIGVAWGYHSPEELLEAGAQAVAENPGELEDLLNG